MAWKGTCFIVNPTVRMNWQLIYLYNDEYKNVERGLVCLNRCVEDNYIQGIEGLANIYFNGELVEET